MQKGTGERIAATVAAVLVTFGTGLPAANGQAATGGGSAFAGEFRSSELRLVLAPSGSGSYTGTIYFQQAEMPAVVRQQSAGYATGTFMANGGTFPFDLTREGAVVTLSTQGKRYILNAAGQANQPGNPLAVDTPVDRPSTAAPTPRYSAGGVSQRTPYSGAPAASASANSNSIVGNWRSSNGTMSFNQDGTGAGNGEAFRYQTAGGYVTMANQQGSIRLAYQVQGDTMTLTGPGGSISLERADGNGRGTGGTTYGAAGGAPGGMSGGGSVAQELAGKWCYVSNVNATGGGARSSNICFVLMPDGRYEYSGETDSYGRAGGSTSQSSDRGTWTATESTITARSVTGRVTTYALQKRNHPKNNDPMLVLDGQAFVTFYQKPAWRY